MSAIAKMGYVGYVNFKGGTSTMDSVLPQTGVTVRATSASLMLKQAIEKPDLVDSKPDQTVFQIMPKIVDGDIAFPLVGDEGVAATGCTTEDTSLGEKLWKLSTKRNGQGRMTHNFDTTIRYSDNLAYKYGGCYINRMEMSVTEQGPINCTLNVIGGANNGSKLRSLETEVLAPTFVSPVRILTWADVRLGIWKDSTTKLARPEEIREFSASVDNQIERYYTFFRSDSGRDPLGPQDIAAKKRKIEGRLKLMGHSQILSDFTETNDTRCSAQSGVSFGYSLCGGGNNNISWATGFTGVIFTIEEVNLSTGLFETSTTWTAMGTCFNKDSGYENYQATFQGGNYNPEAIFPGSAGAYGATTITDFLSPGNSND